ncbi:MAG: choice-of-anchor Q domain-containing protein, partial [Acidimicrobiia bacterium]
SSHGSMSVSWMYVEDNTSSSGPAMLIQSGAAELGGGSFEGNQSDKGGAIRVEGGAEFVAANLRVTDNSAREGGGISVDAATASLQSSTITGNDATIGGGGIALQNGAMFNGVDLIVDGNQAGANGGGILSKASTISLLDSEVSGNEGKDGGGIANAVGSSADLVSTVVTENSASDDGGGVFNAGSDLTITSSSVVGNRATNRGGAIANIRSSENGRVFVTNSTVALNEAPRGAAIDNLDAFVSLDHVTMTENIGSPAFYEDKSPPWTTPVNTIIAGNPDGDCDSLLHSTGGNVVGDCVFADTDGEIPGEQPTDVLGVDDPLLIPVGTPRISYYRVLPASPALDVIPPSGCTQVADQIGTARPQGAACESGSIEVAVDPAKPTINLDLEFGERFVGPRLTLAGVATDDEGVWKVTMAIKRRSFGDWLQDDLVTWGPWNTIRLELDAPDGQVTNFALDLELRPGNYSVAARAVDRDRNYAEIVPYRHFSVTEDWVPPVVNADYAPDTVFGSPTVLTGTAVDSSVIDRVRIAIKDRVTKLWLQADMSWGSTYYGFTPDTVGLGTGDVTWSLGVSLQDGKYNTSVRAQDASGNWGNLEPWRRFSVDSS